MKFLKKYEKLVMRGLKFHLFSKRPKLYNTICHFSDGNNASEPYNLLVIETKNNIKKNSGNFRYSMSKHL